MRSERTMNHARAVCASATSTFGVSVILLLAVTVASAQAPMSAMPAQQGTTDSADQNRQMADQIAELRGQVARLQAAVQQTGPGKKGSAKSGMKMSGAPSQGIALKDDGGEMGGMSPAGGAPVSPGMGDDEMGGTPMGAKGSASPAPAMGMCCGKGATGGNPNMSQPPADTGGTSMNGSSSAMPGQAGASHIYHIGSNGFFLNHSRHITLTQDQRLTLNHLKEKAMLDSAYEKRRMDQAEQELYMLTGADQPDNAKIQAKISEIEKLRSGERMNFIRSVEEASNVLTPEQRKVLLGTMTPAK